MLPLNETNIYWTFEVFSGRLLCVGPWNIQGGYLSFYGKLFAQKDTYLY